MAPSYITRLTGMYISAYTRDTEADNTGVDYTWYELGGQIDREGSFGFRRFCACAVNNIDKTTQNAYLFFNMEYKNTAYYEYTQCTKIKPP